ncbi:hypothetical protein ACF0H5_019661 [Mactra antiquata]
MPGYIIVDVKTRKILLICAAVTVATFVVGILIGYFSAKGSNDKKMPLPKYNMADAIRSECKSGDSKSTTWRTYFDRYVERHTRKHMCINDPTECWDFDLPRHYIAYHLGDKSINIDGKLDEEAWNEAPWSETFVDMRSDVYPKPYYDTKFKIRWDDERLYVGAYIQEENLWATYDKHDSSIWKENGFEMLMDVDGSMFNYKQIQINVLGTMMDQILYKSPMDAENGKKVNEKEWHAEPKKAVYYDGTVNKPGDIDKYWTAEMSFAFSKLYELYDSKPQIDDVWFIQFGRSEQNLTATNGKYEKVKGSSTDWWSWQPCDAINLHLQDRWGLVQFKKNLRDRKFRFEKWHIYKSLFDMMDALKKYKAINGAYTSSIEELDVPPYLLSGACVHVPEIKLSNQKVTLPDGNETTIRDFDVTVKSKYVSHAPAHIRSDRYVQFKN